MLVKTYEEHNFLNLVVSDQGPGLSEQALKPLTDPQPMEETNIKNASDLSLTIVRKYTEAMGGTISCDTEPGKGASFNLKFKDFTPPASDGKFWGIFKT